MKHTVYSAALRVVGIAICGGVLPPNSFWMLYSIALEASIGEPPPTATIHSQPVSLYFWIPLRMPEIGECSPISKNVVPKALCSLRIDSTLLTTFVCLDVHIRLARFFTVISTVLPFHRDFFR